MKACRPMSVEREQPTQPGSVRVDTISPWRKDAMGRDSPGGPDHLRVIRTGVVVIVVLREQVSLDWLALAADYRADRVPAATAQIRRNDVHSSDEFSDRRGKCSEGM